MSDISAPGASRRSFLAGAGLTSVLAGTGVLSGALATDAVAATPPPLTSAKYALTLDGVAAGGPTLVTGGGAVGQVEVVTTGTTQKKHLAGVKYEDIAIQCGTGMSNGFYNAIAGFAGGKAPTHAGTVTERAGISPGTVIDAIGFTGARISSVAFPALDAASKDAASMTVSFTPTISRRGVTPGAGVPVSKTAEWLVSNFRLQIAGVNCTGVAKIDAFTIKQALLVGGTVSNPTLVPGALQVPNLTVTLTQASSANFYSWFQTMVVDGTTEELNGQLTFLAPNLTSTIFAVRLNGLGIFRCEPVTTADGSAAAPMVTASMYCDQMLFTVGPGIAG